MFSELVEEFINELSERTALGIEENFYRNVFHFFKLSVKWNAKKEKWKGFRLSPSGYWNDPKKTKVCLRVTTYNVFEIWLMLSIRNVTVQYLRSDFVQWNLVQR